VPADAESEAPDAATTAARAAAPEGTPVTGPLVWAIGGGKGGVGKSVIASGLAIEAARAGRRTILVDGDLGGANLDTLLGCERPAASLSDFFSRKVATLAEVAAPTAVPGLLFVAGDADSLAASNPAWAQKEKLIRHLRKLPCELVVVDLGAGTSLDTLDLYLAADVGLTVTTPEPTALQNAFAFIKAATLRDFERRTKSKRREPVRGSLRAMIAEAGPDARAVLGRRTKLVVNEAGDVEARRVVNLLHEMVGRFLGGQVELAGVVRRDPVVPAAVKRMSHVLLLAPESAAACDLSTLAHGLLDPRPAPSPSRTAFGVNESLVVQGTALHLQTEDLGDEQAAVRSQAFLPDGRVIYSRRTPYRDAFFLRLQAAAGDRVRLHHTAIKRALEQGRIPIAGGAPVVPPRRAG
jgi:flagellar biosynthesis protein FlhG